MVMVTKDEDVPTLTAEQIKDQSDIHLVSGIGYAIAVSGLKRTNELCEMLGLPTHHKNVLISAKHIVGAMKEMHVALDLDRDRTLTARIEITIPVEDDCSFCGSHTVQ